MKSLLVSLFLVIVAFLHFTGGQRRLEDIRTFQYNHAIHPYLSGLAMRITGRIYHLRDAKHLRVTLVARGGELIGWVDHETRIQPFFQGTSVLKYNLDYGMRDLNTDMGHLGILGVFHLLSHLPQKYYPMRRILYYPGTQKRLEVFTKRINNVTVEFTAGTSLILRAGWLIGWLNSDYHVKPIYKRESLVVYNLEEHMHLIQTMEQLVLYGVGMKLVVNYSDASDRPLPEFPPTEAESEDDESSGHRSTGGGTAGSNKGR